MSESETLPDYGDKEVIVKNLSRLGSASNKTDRQ